MPKDLGDVLHYLLPEVEPPAPEVPIIAIPVGERDLVRAALVWNLAIELARRGSNPTLVVPRGGESCWPVPGRGPLGIEVRATEATTLRELVAEVRLLASGDPAVLRPSALLLVRVPPAWMLKAAEGDPLLRRSLLFASPERQDLMEAYALTKGVTAAYPDARVGVTFHGVRSVADAEQAFTRLAGAVERHIGRGIDSYGLLLDDVHVYRAIVSRRPIGLSYPQSPTARALQDVARLLLEDAAFV